MHLGQGMSSPHHNVRRQMSELEDSDIRIVIVDDEREHALALQAELARATGVRVATFGSVSEIENWMAGAKADQILPKVEVVFTDVMLPDGSGWDVVELMNARSGCQAIAWSGWTRSTLAEVPPNLRTVVLAVVQKPDTEQPVAMARSLLSARGVPLPQWPRRKSQVESLRLMLRSIAMFTEDARIVVGSVIVAVGLIIALIRFR